MLSAPTIRTPDHRLRVFVSSTLGELADERAAVRAAIERLRLTPVMFELGARPHAPRSLYRAYLAQSHVFVGIYWQRYGWIAPGEHLSGLEDEYRLAGARPRLLYIKHPAPNADPRLLELIQDFANDDIASFKKFGSAAELSDLVANDLAVVLTERFEASSTELPHRGPSHLPSPAYPIVDREHELREVVGLLRSGSRLVTLTGIGGIGKTRLALEVARSLVDEVRVAFIGLGTVTDSDAAIRTIAEALRVRTEGAIAEIAAIAEQLRGSATLLVLDNAEQVADVGAALSQLLEEAPDLQMLVTSRRALRIRAEREVRVAPLALPPEHSTDVSINGDGPAMRLFLDRAAAVGQTIAPSAEQADTLREISRRLEGIPLAIELAAAWTRMLPLRALLERLEDPLAALIGGAADAPERQQTMRATIEWSYNLLDDSERTLVERLSVFVNGWTIEAAEAVCATGDLGVIETLSSLLDASLVTPQSSSVAALRFMMFEPVRSYCAERLDAAGERALMQRRHLDYYCDLAARAQPALCGAGQRHWVERLEPERADLRRAIDYALSANRHASVVELTWDVIVLYFVLDAVEEPASWLTRVSEARPALDRVTTAKLRSLHALTEVHAGRYEGVDAAFSESLIVFRRAEMDFETAVTLHQIGFVRYHLNNDELGAIAVLRESSALFDRIDHDWGVALAETMLASVFSATHRVQPAAESAARALSRARKIDNEPLIVQAFHQLAFIRLLEHRERDAFALLDESIALLQRNGLRTDGSYCLDALAQIALDGGDATTAAEAVAKAALERTRLRVAPWPTIAPAIERVANATQRRIGPEAYEATRDAVAEQDLFELLDSIRERVRAMLGLADGVSR